jgi:hypothetical protein
MNVFRLNVNEKGEITAEVSALETELDDFGQQN